MALDPDVSKRTKKPGSHARYPTTLQAHTTKLDKDSAFATSAKKTTLSGWSGPPFPAMQLAERLDVRFENLRFMTSDEIKRSRDIVTATSPGYTVTSGVYTTSQQATYNDCVGACADSTLCTAIGWEPSSKGQGGICKLSLAPPRNFVDLLPAHYKLPKVGALSSAPLSKLREAAMDVFRKTDPGVKPPGTVEAPNCNTVALVLQSPRLLHGLRDSSCDCDTLCRSPAAYGPGTTGGLLMPTSTTLADTRPQNPMLDFAARNTGKQSNWKAVKPDPANARGFAWGTLDENITLSPSGGTVARSNYYRWQRYFVFYYGGSHTEIPERFTAGMYPADKTTHRGGVKTCLCARDPGRTAETPALTGEELIRSFYMCPRRDADVETLFADLNYAGGPLDGMAGVYAPAFTEEKLYRGCENKCLYPPFK